MTHVALWLARYQLKSKRPALRLRALRRLRTALNDAVIALDDTITITLLDHVLTDPETEIRRESAAILGDLRDTRAVPALVHALNDRQEIIQETAIQGLKQIDDRTSVSALVQKLFNGSPAIQWRAAQALRSLGWQPETTEQQIYFHIACGEIKQVAHFGSEAVKPLVELLSRDATDKKIAAVNVLGEIGDAAALKPMQLLLRDPEPLVRSSVIYAFERAGFRDAAASLIPLLKDAARNVRLAAALVVGELGELKAVEPLIQLLNDKDWEIRRAALESLGKLGDKRAFPSVARHLDDSDQEVREVAADAIGNVGNESIVEKLVFTMVDPHNGVRQAAQRALTRIFPNWARSERVKRLLPEIQAAMKHRDVSVQNAAASLFQRVAGPAVGGGTLTLTSQPTKAPEQANPAVDLLRELLRDAEAEVRLAAAETIGRMRIKEMESDLLRASGDADGTVKSAIQASLARLAQIDGAAHSQNVVFISRTSPVLPAADSESPVEDVLLCTGEGEVLHDHKCRGLSRWLKSLEYFAPQAERLAQLMMLGSFKRLTIQTKDARILLFVTLEGAAMIRVKHARVASLPDSSEAGFTGAAKEATAHWLHRMPSTPGVLLRGIRYPDQTMLCDADSRDLTVAALEESFRSVSEAFQWLKSSRLTALKMTWSGERGALHCICRPDRVVLGVLAKAQTSGADLCRLDAQMQDFLNCDPVCQEAAAGAAKPETA